MQITWEIEDGYVRGSAPHHTEIPDDELAELDNDNDREKLIQEYIQADFDESIAWYETDRES